MSEFSNSYNPISTLFWLVVVGFSVFFLMPKAVDCLTDILLKGTVNVYPVMLPHSPGNDSSSTVTLEPKTFVVFPSTQRVVQWSNYFSPLRYDNCAIRDRTHWACFDSDGVQLMGLNDLHFVESISPAGWLYVNYLTWHWYWLLNKINTFPS